MLRITGCLLAVLLALLPATAQAQQRGASAMPTEHAENVQVAETYGAFRTTTASVSMQDGRTRPGLPVDGLGELRTMDASSGSTVRQQAGAFAAAVFRALAAQNTIDLHPELDAVLRPPESDSQDPNLFDGAKDLYDAATSYRSEKAVLTIDPLSLRCRLRIDLGRLMGGTE